MTVRRTKIVATLGPASNSPEVLEQLILAGLDVARLNFSHGTPDEHKARARLIRDIAARHGRHVALLGDLQGPKIRIAKFANKRGFGRQSYWQSASLLVASCQAWDRKAL